MRVFWTQRATRELRAHRHALARKQTTAGARHAELVVAAAERLTTYPRYGGKTGDQGVGARELPVARTPFTILYAIDDVSNLVVVLRVVSGAK